MTPADYRRDAKWCAIAMILFAIAAGLFLGAGL